MLEPERELEERLRAREEDDARVEDVEDDEDEEDEEEEEEELLLPLRSLRA